LLYSIEFNVMMADTEYTRLHITPLNPSILNTILPPSILPNARNISYHNIQTFPEKSYGYVELPVIDADKLKKKLNGSILKGTKVRIDTARPQKETVVEEATEEPERRKREKKKRKRDELPGVDIGERHVKRGWTTPGKDLSKSKDMKTVNKSKFTTGPECLFKTVLPPNVASKSTTKVAETTSDKRKKKRGKEAIVHEFTKTTKYATFLRGSSGSSKKKAVAEFVEDKGWVDEDGNVVEAVTKTRKKGAISKPITSIKQSSSSEDGGDTSESSSDESDQMDVDLPVKEDTEKAEVASPMAQISPTSEETSENTRSKLDLSAGRNLLFRPLGIKPQNTKDDEDKSRRDLVKDTRHLVAPKSAEEPEAALDEGSSSDDNSDPEDEISKTPINAALDVESSSDSSSAEEENTPVPQPPAEVDSTSEESSDNESDQAKDESSLPLTDEVQADLSSFNSSEDSDAEDSSSSEDDSVAEEPPSATISRPQSSAGQGLTIKIPESINSTPITTSVHPLEALYKRTKTENSSTPKPAASSFSFFGGDNDEDDDIEVETHLQVPLTPFTQKDFEYRGIRSAAPTPDTAHPNKRFIWPSKDDEDGDDEDRHEASSPIRKSGPVKGKGGKDDEEESEFQKWFWENRGNVNRAWKKRKRTVAKEKRQRDSRKRQVGKL
jgi:hypothetical protein